MSKLYFFRKDGKIREPKPDEVEKPFKIKKTIVFPLTFFNTESDKIRDFYTKFVQGLSTDDRRLRIRKRKAKANIRKMRRLLKGL